MNLTSINTENSDRIFFHSVKLYREARLELFFTTLLNSIYFTKAGIEMHIAVTKIYFSKEQLFLPIHSQKQSSRGVLRKRCSENMQQIYRRTLMSKCDFNKVPEVFLGKGVRTSAWVFSYKFQNFFSYNRFWTFASAHQLAATT